MKNLIGISGALASGRINVTPLAANKATQQLNPRDSFSIRFASLTPLAVTWPEESLKQLREVFQQVETRFNVPDYEPLPESNASLLNTVANPLNTVINQVIQKNGRLFARSPEKLAELYKPIAEGLRQLSEAAQENLVAFIVSNEALLRPTHPEVDPQNNLHQFAVMMMDLVPLRIKAAFILQLVKDKVISPTETPGIAMMNVLQPDNRVHLEGVLRRIGKRFGNENLTKNLQWLKQLSSNPINYAAAEHLMTLVSPPAPDFNERLSKSESVIMSLGAAEPKPSRWMTALKALAKPWTLFQGKPPAGEV